MAAQPDGPLMSGNRAARDEERALIAARSAWASSVVVQWGGRGCRYRAAARVAYTGRAAGLDWLTSRVHLA